MDEEALLKFHQSQLFALDADGISRREKTQRLRHVLLFYHGLLSRGKIDNETYKALTTCVTSEYSSCVDDPATPHDGLFDELMKTTESINWKSCLSLNDRQPVCTKTSEPEGKTVRINFSKFTVGKRKQNKGGNDGSSTCTARRTTDELRASSSVVKQVPVFGKTSTKPCGFENFDCVRESNPTSNERFQKKKSIVYGSSNPKAAVVQENEMMESDCDNPFRTAGEMISEQQPENKNSISAHDYGTSSKRSLGTRRTGATAKFVPPISRNGNEEGFRQAYNVGKTSKKNNATSSKYEAYEWMKNVDERMIELIENEIMENGPDIKWDDIAGLEFAKNTVQEIVVWPMLRPDIFTGLRGPPKGLLLFGPPGTGKTLIGKCIASQSKATFFSISASSLTSKWVGEGEKMVRALFGVARCHQPSVVFIDEIDSLLTSRSGGEHESSRRIKTEFLVQLDGTTCTSAERILIVGATNRPQELDEAARRRLVKRLYIPLPESAARKKIVSNLLTKQSNEINDNDLERIAASTQGYSGADVANLCREAALGPIRAITDITNINADDVRPVNIGDFEIAFRHVRPSVSKNDLQIYVDWNKTYGSGGGER